VTREPTGIPPALPPIMWPENTVPTAEQWRDWFLKASPEAQAWIASRVLDVASIADRCILENHAEAVARRHSEGQRLARAWAEGYGASGYPEAENPYGDPGATPK
jgi:hypothetical protein